MLRLTRRAKYIIAEMESGLGARDASRHDGALHHPAQGRADSAETPGAFYYDYDADPRHDHVVFGMSNGDVIRYNDVRRFGYMTLFAAKEMARHPLFKDLGVEPLSGDLTPAYLAQARVRQNAAAEKLSCSTSA